jgi:hypothetical protein
MSNQGFVTEQTHYEILSNIFDYVSPPKNSGVGSDFLVVADGTVATFESKTSNTDIFDFGVMNVFANGFIHSTSSFLSNNQVEQLQGIMHQNVDKLAEYTSAANTLVIPHVIPKTDYDRIKADRKLVHIVAPEPVESMIESSMTKSTNMFIKANYLAIGDRLFLTSENPDLDPLGLRNFGAPVLDNSHIDYMSIRTARAGARGDKCSVSMRVQFRLKKDLPESKVRLK